MAVYLVYVDESGDSGLINSPTKYFALAGVVVHELRWKVVLEELIGFRREIRLRFGLKLRDEIHAAELLRNPGNLWRIPKHHRLEIIRRFADAIASIQDISILMVLLDKSNKPQGFDVFDHAWRALIQRFENTILWQNFPGPKNADERGILFADNTDGNKLTRLLRKLRLYNPIPNQPAFGPGYRNIPLIYIIEDPNLRDSAYSLFVQAADLCAFLLFQKHAPSSYMRKKSGQNYFSRLSPAICAHAAPRDPDRIVRL
jgi:hypothetical protein